MQGSCLPWSTDFGVKGIGLTLKNLDPVSCSKNRVSGKKTNLNRMQVSSGGCRKSVKTRKLERSLNRGAQRGRPYKLCIGLWSTSFVYHFPHNLSSLTYTVCVLLLSQFTLQHTYFLSHTSANLPSVPFPYRLGIISAMTTTIGKTIMWWWMTMTTLRWLTRRKRSFASSTHARVHTDARRRRRRRTRRRKKKRTGEGTPTLMREHDDVYMTGIRVMHIRVMVVYASIAIDLSIKKSIDGLLIFALLPRWTNFYYEDRSTIYVFIFKFTFP